MIVLSYRCVSAWNDNGKTGLINETAPELLYRTDFFPGLGWMLTKGGNLTGSLNPAPSGILLLWEFCSFGHLF